MLKFFGDKPIYKGNAASEVWRGEWQSKPVAIKRFDRTHDRYIPDRVKDEFEINRLLMNHAHIIQLYQLEIDSERSFCFIFEWMDQGALDEWIINLRKLSARDKQDLNLEIICFRMMKEIILGVSHIHQHNFLHRDIKSANILVDGHLRIKIGDFGFAVAGNAIETDILYATTEYIAPELARVHLSKANRNYCYTQKTDTWSLGITLLELARQRICSSAYMTIEEAFTRARDGVCDPIPSTLPIKYYTILNRCLIKSPVERSSILDIILSMRNKNSLPEEFVNTNIVEEVPSAHEQLQVYQHSFWAKKEIQVNITENADVDSDSDYTAHSIKSSCCIIS